MIPCQIRSAALVLMLAGLPTVGVWAQAIGEGGNTPGVKVVPAKHVTDGVVRKVSLETGRLTIQHGDIRHLGLPPMTTVFPLKDRSVLDKIQVGDKVKFIAEREAGRLIVIDIKLVK